MIILTIVNVIIMIVVCLIVWNIDNVIRELKLQNLATQLMVKQITQLNDNLINYDEDRRRY